MNDRTLNSDDADQLRDLADRLERARGTAADINDANPGAARQLTEFVLQAVALADLAREIAEYADAVGEGRVRHVTGVADVTYGAFGDKVQLHVPGELEPLVASIYAIINDTGLTRDQVDGQALRFTVITTTEEDQVDTPTGFQVVGPVSADE